MVSISKLQLIALLLIFIKPFVSSLNQQDFLNCDSNSQYTYGYRCDGNASHSTQCDTFALLRTNSHYSSLYNLSFELGLNRGVLAAANGLPGNADVLPKDQILLIPLNCKCNGGVFGAELTKTTRKGESFDDIVEALQGLTTCNAIQERNPSVNLSSLGGNVGLVVPLRCACPSNVVGQNANLFLLTYPVSVGDSVSNLATKFSISQDSIVSANNRPESSGFFNLQDLQPLSTLLIPLHGKPVLARISEPNVGYRFIKKHKKSKMKRMGVYIGVSGAAFGVIIAIVAAFFMIQRNKKKQHSPKDADMELQQLSLSVRTVSEKKVSFEGSQDTYDGQIIEATPHKMRVETYTLEELRKATEDFSSSNLIEDSVFHGRLNGKNLAIKCSKTEIVSKIEFGLFQDAVHHHPNIIRLMGTCVSDGSGAYLVFEYAKNGSLKDWLHGGLAMKSQFIASCYCFLTWNQRIRICLDIATALQYMHQIMNPSYIHRNIKSRNVFIDEEFNAKLGNFGIVENNTRDQSQEAYSSHPWERGYLAPECLEHYVPSMSVDVFAYGVVLLEILSGKPPVGRGNEKGETLLLSERIKVVLQSENADELREWMDNVLGENYSFDQAVTLANLARACVEDDPCLRPNAGEIVEKLAKLVEELPQGEEFSICESSSKPLVKAAVITANNM